MKTTGKKPPRTLSDIQQAREALAAEEARIIAGRKDDISKLIARINDPDLLAIPDDMLLAGLFAAKQAHQNPASDAGKVIADARANMPFRRRKSAAQ